MALVVLTIGTSSCSLGDDNSTDVQLQYASITSVNIPDALVFGEVNDIVVTYNNPSSCSTFAGFDVNSSLNEREVAVVTNFINDGTCETTNVPTEQTLRFFAASNGNYVFRFFTGLDDAGQPQYLEYTVEVVE